MTGDDELVDKIKTNFRIAAIDDATRLILEFAEKVTNEAISASEEDIVALKQAGFQDEAILDIVHITGYFNHINRVADALGVELEDFMIQG